MTTAAGYRLGPGRRPLPPPDGVPRLLAGLDGRSGPVGFTEHMARWGPLPDREPAGRLTDEVEASGLVGHGGAWFPVATKWRAVDGRRSRRPVVVANGAEGEPASLKDRLLLGRAPHLVLDGASVAARALDASSVVVYAGERYAGLVRRAVEERRRAGVDPVHVRVAVAPDVYLAGQESAAVNVLNGSPSARPSFVGIRSVRQRGVAGRPTLVQNVETLAHVALVARFGAPWFRSAGSTDTPGTMLLTVHGRWAEPAVVEAPLGAELFDVLDLAGYDVARYRGALLGGYGGGWVSLEALAGLRLTDASARRAGATLGAGVVALLPHHVCPLAEVARVVEYMHRQGAGQCGPCRHGLGALAGLLQVLAFGRAPRRTVSVRAILELCDLVEGRGACRHPDGVARFVRSACAVHGDEITAHLRAGPCRSAGRSRWLPVPPARRRGAAVPGAVR